MEETWDTIFRDTTRFWVQFVFVPVVVIIGVLGNSLTIYILTRKKMHLSSKVYLTALTISDLLFLLFSFSMTWKHYECMKSVHLYWKYMPFGLWITDASSSTSVWLTVAFTIERYAAICHPILTKCHSRSTQHRAAFVATCVFIICFLLTASTSFEWRVVSSDTWENISANHTIFGLENTDLGKNAWYRLIYRCFSTVFFVFLPLLILTVGNFFLINAVRSSHKTRQNLVSCYVHRHQAQKMRQKDRITINLIVIILVFFICQLPTAAILIYTSMHTPLKDSVEENVLLGLGNLFNLLVAINAECNFLLYTAISEKYRRSFIRLFCLESIFRRLYERKRRNVIVLNALVLSSNRANMSKPIDVEDLSGEKKSESQDQEECEVRRRCLVTLRKCTTCELINNISMSSSSTNCSIGPVSV